MSNQLLHDLYKVERVTSSDSARVPPRRGPIRPIPGLTMYEANTMKLRAYERWGLTEYNKCWTFEPFKRPIPYVSTDEKPQQALDKFNKYGPAILDFLAPHVVPHIQTYNKQSAIGYPINENPIKRGSQRATDEAVARIFARNNLPAEYLQPEGERTKMDILNALFAELDARDISRYKNSKSTIGGRLQNEPPTKARKHLFINDEGGVYEYEINEADRTEYISELGDMVGSRYRGVVNPAAINLYIQAWDSMLHTAIMQFPLCDSNVYTKYEWADVDDITTFDCKHYERYLGRVVLAYAELVGGPYAEWLTKLVRDPYLVTSDTRRSTFLITPQFGPGRYPQFGSGLAPVADIGKLTNICVRVAFYVEVKGLTVQNAIQVTLDGRWGGLRHWMYGDDNRVQGPAAERKEFLGYVGEHFDIELDDVEKYLGMKLRKDIRRFVLSAETYNLKLYQSERDYEWRTYPYLGNVLRRKTFAEFGEPEIAKDIIPFEDELFDAVDHPYHEMVAAAASERRKADARGEVPSEKEVTDKRYLMTPEEEKKTGLFQHLPPERTRAMVLNMVGEPLKKKLRI